MVKHVLPPLKVKSFDEIEIGKAFIRRIQDRIERNRDYRAIFVGQTGSGKTYSAISLAWMIDNDMGVENIVFTPEAFMQRIISAARNPRKWKGKPIILDEAGIVVPSQEWMTKVTRSISMVSQTYRFLNLIVFYTAPSLGDIASPQRRLFHSVFVTSPEVHNPSGVAKRYHYATVNVYDIAYDPIGFGKNQFKAIPVKPRIVNTKTGQIGILENLHIHHPPKSLIIEYEKHKRDFLTVYYEEQLQKIIEEKGTLPGQYENVEAVISRIMSSFNNFVYKKHGRYSISPKKITDILGVPYTTAKLLCEIIKSRIERKYGSVDEFVARTVKL